ncbi:MAG TPA: type I-U CRISPR-associated RAMP protein Csb1/Cas7u [Pirellulales bacterium]|nr:type I-U CRISPR-associated RAMP protein Csb1/Cas7u [Pirellulales bacterium]
MQFDSAAAVRLRARMQPAAGPGTFVQPPTYAGARSEVLVAHHKRRIAGEDVHCTLIGSVAAMANRLEESLAAMRADGFPLSVAEVHDEVDGYPLHESTLTMPHRGADAIARSCTVDGKPYMQTEPGKALLGNTSNVLPLVKWHQAMLLLGGWYSARSHGGIRIPRGLHCEVVAIRSVPCSTVGGRFDVTPASNTVPVYRVKGDGIPFDMTGKGKANKPSELPIGMIPSGVEERGVTADYYDLSAVLSLGTIRRLRCGEIDAAPLHKALAWLGVAVLLRTVGDGINLRSRCQLIPEVAPALEVVKADGATEPLPVSLEEARKRGIEAVEECNRSGIHWGNETVTLVPSEQLRNLISRSLAVGVEE